MDVLEDFIVDKPYTPTEEELATIDELTKKGLVPGDWESQKGGILSFKKNMRKYMYKKQNYKCAYCRMDLSDACFYLDREHIIPKSPHPQWMFRPSNLCVSCEVCNTNKSDKEVLLNPDNEVYPESSEEYKIVNPFLDKYSDNINIKDDLIYVGLTEKGKSTIQMCNLSRGELVLERARKKMINGNPDSVQSKVLSLLENNEDDDKKEIFEQDLLDMVKIFKGEF